MCAAISAARLGNKVAIVQDRKVFGGNNSSEVRVGLGGRLNIGKFPSLGYLLNEFGPARMCRNGATQRSVATASVIKVVSIVQPSFFSSRYSTEAASM